MLRVRGALDRLTPARDGVDGKRIFLYGEGWNFGEVANDARFVQATQAQHGRHRHRRPSPTGCATRCAAAGRSTRTRACRASAAGLSTDPNGVAGERHAAEQRARLLHYQDLIKLGLAGNLRDYTFVDRAGRTVTGAQVDYNGQPAGYAADPARRSPTSTRTTTRRCSTRCSTSCRTHVDGRPGADEHDRAGHHGAGQGPPFWHAGNDLLRSKSLDRNSYDSGDWFNRHRLVRPRVDVRLRPASAPRTTRPSGRSCGRCWPTRRCCRGGRHAARPRARRRAARIRFSSPLFRLGTAAAIQERVVPGRRARPDAGRDRDGDRRHRRGRTSTRSSSGIVVVFNASPEATSQTRGRRRPAAATRCTRCRPPAATRW